MILGANIHSEDKVTIEFDYSKTSIENDFTEIRYEELQNKIITNNITLPYYKIYIADDIINSAMDIDYNISNQILVFQTENRKPDELPTSDNYSRTYDIISNIKPKIRLDKCLK